MAHIYANAYITIVAADGKDADHGIRGVDGSGEARKMGYSTIRLPDGSRITPSPTQTRLLQDTTWASRGWTFQEALFSRRMLVFNGSVTWMCHAATYEEPIRASAEDDDPRHPEELLSQQRNRPSNEPQALNFAMRPPLRPDLRQWTTLVESYNKRMLSFDEDVMNAFSGVTTTFNGLCNEAILWGIPEMSFDYCIIWKPRSSLRRRRASCNSSAENKLPSWSWAGWQGHIHHECSEGKPFEIKLQPVVKWYKSRTSDTVGSDLSLVKNAGSLHWPTAIRIPYSAPDNESRYLIFNAQRAWLLVGQYIEAADESWTAGIVSLYDKIGNWAGSLRLHTSPSNGPRIGEACELLALSLGSTETGSADQSSVLSDDAEHHPVTKVYEFYNVMWIEWENGIAYRKAVGTVYEDRWQMQNPKWIRVVLG
ncbi:MAG: hypothetical protein Q9221_005832 [Calogaya cf. arnoldii]